MPTWHVLLIAAATTGGAMLIENGHRVDTGAPDDDIAASAPVDCTVIYAVNRTRMSSDDEKALRQAAISAAPPECADR